MNTSNATHENPDYARDGGHYFAFVESIDTLDGERLRDRDALPGYWSHILDIRNAGALDPPTHRIWLDCVRRDYFLSLDWREETCTRNRIDDANKRRRQLLEMDTDQLATVLLLMNRDDEDDALERLQEGSWHQIELRPSHGLPVVVAPDFDLVAARLYYLRWKDEVPQLERDWLLNVFNLEFVLDADLGERGGPTWRPYSGPPSKEAEFTYPYNRPLWR